MSKPVISIPDMLIPILKSAATIALIKKTSEGEKRSEIVNTAKTNVPEIKPNCTALVRCAKKSEVR